MTYQSQLTSSDNKDMLSLFKIIYENDLKVTKDKVIEQVQYFKGKSDKNTKDIQTLKLENSALRNHIKRYMLMISEA